jgi:hypothetical protein
LPFNFLISTSLITNAGASDPGPYLLPPFYNPPPSIPISNLSFLIPFAVGSASSGCTVPLTDKNTDFTLGWVQPPNKGPLVAQVTVVPTNLYTPANVGSLWQSFIAFKQQLEQLPAGCLAPDSLAYIFNQISLSLPLAYNWILPFTYGLSSDGRYVDLNPGMTLVVDYGSYQYLGVGTSPPGKRNAYAGAGTTRYRVRRRSDGTIGFNAFNDATRSFTVDTIQPNQIAGLWDLEAAGATANYVRLIYPASLQNTTDTSNLPNAAQNPVLLYASSIENLETATSNYVSGGDPGNTGTVAFFSGRAAIYPEIVVNVNGFPTPVPIGTTLTDVVADQLNLSKFDNWGSLPLTLTRWAQTMTNSQSTPPYAPAQVPLNMSGTLSPTGVSQWDLPLVAGDSIRWVPS